MRSQSCGAMAFLMLAFFGGTGLALDKPIKVTFDGKVSERKWSLKQLDPQWPSDWSSYDYLVIEMRTSSPQRFSLWIYTGNGRRRVMFQPFGQNIWLRVDPAAVLPRQRPAGQRSGLGQ